MTGLGVITSLGAGKTDNWAKLTAGQSGIHAITRFPTDGLRTRIAGTIDFLPARACTAALTENLAELAAEEAIAESGIGARGDFPGPLFLAVPPIEMEWPQRIELAAKSGANDKVSYNDLLRASAEFPDYHERFLFGSVADHLADKFGTKGSPISLSTACASGASAIQLGVEAIRRGETDAALCIGTDGSISPEALIRFSLLSALSTSNDDPQGAAQALRQEPRRLRHGGRRRRAGAGKLRSRQGARRQDPRRAGRLRRDGGRLPPHPLEPRRQADHRLHRQCASRMPGLTPDDIDYVNAHGTGTPENDKMEYLGVSAVFGERMKSIPISSNKSMIGHTLSAAGAVEAVFTLLTLQHQRIPPTINYKVPDPAIPLDVVPNKARDARVRHAISNSFGFGGQNVSLVMGLEPAA